MISFPAVFLTVNLIFPTVLSWGAQGHQIVGSIAQQFLSPSAESMLASILESDGNSQSSDLLASVANWADQVKYTSQYRATAPLHYIDIQDAPPTKCELQETRDCSDGKCIVGAIAKYSFQAICSVDNAKKAEAIKFIVHFFGDVTQPLHNEDRDRGGNDIKVLYGKKHVNLHHLWDAELVEARISQFGTEEGYVKYLLGEIREGQYAKQKSAWISSHSYDETSKYGNSLLAIDYARDTNQFDCGVNGVWSSYDNDPSQDFSGSYAENASPIVDLQLAKGGYRLGLYLTHLFSSSCNSSKPISFAKYRRR